MRFSLIFAATRNPGFDYETRVPGLSCDESLGEKSAGFFEQAEGEIAALDHVLGDLEIADALVRGQMVHEVEHELFKDHAQAAGADLASHGFAGDGAGRILGEMQPDVFVLEEALVLLENGVARLGKDFDERGFIELVENAHDGQAADKLGNETVLDEVLRLGFAEQLGIAMRARGGLIGVCIDGAETESLFADAAAYDALEADKGAAADEEDVGGVDSRELLVRMFAAALGRNVGDGALQDLEQGLLHAFAGDIARDGGVLVLAADLVDLVDVDDPLLGASDVAVGGLEKLENDVLDVLADVACLSERGGVDNGEGNVEHLGQRVSEKSLAGAGGTDEKDVGLGQLNFVVAGLVHLDPLVVVVDCDSQLLLGLVLAYDVIVEETFDLSWLGEMACGGGWNIAAAIVVEDRVTDGNALVADVGARVVAGRRDQLGHGVLRLVTERAAKCFFGSRARFHSISPSASC